VRIRRVGFTLFALSFLTPNWDFESMGVGAFIAVPWWVCVTLAEGDVFHNWRAAILIGSWTIGWLSNFTVFFRVPRFLAITAVTAPWILYLAMVFFLSMTRRDFGVTGFIPFYPWAFGIGLIHCSRLMEARHVAGAAPVSPPS